MKGLTLITISVLTVFAVLLIPAISQDPGYHNFADQAEVFGIPNFFNVISNLLFLIVGIIGFRFVSINKQVINETNITNIYRFFFMAVVLVGCGSAYYHLSPDNSTLIWDRLPMSMAFMSFFIIILAEYINEKLAYRLALPLILLGVFSVFYWYWGESLGHGDLRLYGLVQFLPLMLIPLILSLYSSRFSQTYLLWMLLGCYLLAKGFELMDYPVYHLTHIISGHTIKHLVSAGGPFMLYLLLQGAEKNKGNQVNNES